MSNILYDFYVDVADDTKKTIQKTLKSPLAYLSNRTCNSIFLSSVTRIEVNDILNSLNRSKSVGPSSTPIKLLKSYWLLCFPTSCSSCEPVLPVRYLP